MQKQHCIKIKNYFFIFFDPADEVRVMESYKKNGIIKCEYKIRLDLVIEKTKICKIVK